MAKRRIISVIPELLAEAGQSIEVLNDAEPIDFMRLLLIVELLQLIVE